MERRQRARGATVYQALESAGVREPERLEADLRTLEKADQAKQLMAQKVARQFQLDSGGGGGTATQDDAVRISDADYAAIKDAHVQGRPVWERLRHARRLPGGALYDGPGGESRFMSDDHLAAESGVDMLATSEHASRRASAAQAAAAQARKLEDAMRKGTNAGERSRLLDEAIRDGVRQLDQTLGQGASVPSAGRTTRQGPLVAVRTLDDGGGTKTVSLAEFNRLARESPVNELLQYRIR